MTGAGHATPSLTRNQALVLDQLTAASGPLSAYALLDLLRDHGLRAPPQVYRALEKLVALGLVHRLESLNAFVVCQQPGCAPHTAVIFTICVTCGAVAEIPGEPVAGQFQSLAAGADFAVERSVVELRGRCRPCRTATVSSRADA
ncbi:MAG: transcriptional repressor [Thalassobaculaceae bacterium]